MIGGVAVIPAIAVGTSLGETVTTPVVLFRGSSKVFFPSYRRSRCMHNTRNSNLLSVIWQLYYCARVA